MSVSTVISVEEYLASSEYERFEYEDGVAYEKPMPNWNHSELCIWIGILLFKYFPQFRVGAEIRSRLKPNRWRLPDVGVRHESVPPEKYAYTPLYLAIEILSEDDTPEKLFEKCRLYHEWGVPYCWVIDGLERRIWECHREQTPKLVTEEISAGDIRLPVAEVFSRLDDPLEK